MQPKSNITARQGQTVRTVNHQNIAVERFLISAIALSTSSRLSGLWQRLILTSSPLRGQR